MRVLVFLVPLVFAACGSSTTNATDGAVPVEGLAGAGSGGNARSDLGTAASTMTVDVPTDFKGTPRQLLVAAFDQVPVTGPPAGILYQGTPSIAAGASLQLSADATGLSGSKYVIAVLYMQGGGQFSPTPGVDYESHPETVTFAGKPMMLGPLNLALVPLDDGGP